MTSDLTRIADLSLRLGRTHRATFHPDGRTPESDTDHTHMLGMVCLELLLKAPEKVYILGLRAESVMLMVLVHDLVEAYTGDESTLGFASLSEEEREARLQAKRQREAEALAQLREDHRNSSWLVSAIHLYELQNTPSACFVRWVDKILPKLTHELNGGAAIRAAGMTPEQLEADHAAQGRQLRLQYPNLASFLGPIFDEACARSVAAYRAALEAGAVSAFPPPDFAAPGTCYTCAFSPPFPGPAGCASLIGDEGVDDPIIRYNEAAGCNDLAAGGLGRGWPQRTDFACPGWRRRG